uniref:HXK6 n=1 Tax=Arundo donax TaxID=35708 RepID=A0A0A9DMZ8_ARUDO
MPTISILLCWLAARQQRKGEQEGSTSIWPPGSSRQWGFGGLVQLGDLVQLNRQGSREKQRRSSARAEEVGADGEAALLPGVSGLPPGALSLLSDVRTAELDCPTRIDCPRAPPIPSLRRPFKPLGAPATTFDA